jgi:3,4-dihydroxy 2-butanone 4-phosphate synthase/GTP cyclohydrolase II
MTTQEIEESIDWILSGKQNHPSQDAAYRQVGAGAQMLRDLGIRKMNIMSAPLKFTALSGFDLEVVNRVDAP